MSTKTKILEPPKRKTEVQRPAATTQVQAPAVEIKKKETEAVAPTNVVNNATEAMKTVTPMENTPSFLPKEVAQRSKTPTDEDVAKRNMEEFRKWYEKQDGLTDEERAKRDKARAAKSIFATIGDGLASIANLHSTINYAPNMDLTSGMEKLRTRWDKEDAEGRAKAREALSLYQQMKAAQRAEDEIKHRNKREEIADKRYEEEKKYRAKKDAEAKAAQERAEQWAKEKFNKELEADNKRHEATLNNQRNIAYMRQQGNDGNPFKVMISDTETLNIPDKIWKEPANISSIYKALPEHLKQQAIERYATKDGQPTIDFKTGKEVQKYKPMTVQQMRQAIGDFLSDSDAIDAQNVARRLAGQEVSSGLGWGTKKHTTDDEEIDW